MYEKYNKMTQFYAVEHWKRWKWKRGWKKKM